MSRDWKAFYQSEAKTYHDQRYRSWYGQLFAHLHHMALHELLPPPTPVMLVLDIASGAGHNLPPLQGNGRFVIATDLTIEMLQESQKQFDTYNAVHYTVSNALALPFADNTFDVVTTARFLHLFSANTQHIIMLEMKRVLKPGGLLIIDFYNHSHWLLLSPFIAIYRFWQRKRPTEDTRNKVKDVHRWLNEQGLMVQHTIGIGSYLLILARLLPQTLALAVGGLFKHPPLSAVAEQFLVAARKSP